MEKEEFSIEGVFALTPRVFRDDRGCFYESFNQNQFQKLSGLSDIQFVQDNHSVSKYGVLRGMHFQGGDWAQSKLVRVFAGTVLDVIVDLRPNSSTYGKHVSIVLSQENKKQFFVPRGFAHAFVVLSEYAEFGYKCDNFYNKESEGGLLWNDPELNIDWKLDHKDIVVSDKDEILPKLSELTTNPFA